MFKRFLLFLFLFVFILSLIISCKFVDNNINVYRKELLTCYLNPTDKNIERLIVSELDYMVGEKSFKDYIESDIKDTNKRFSKIEINKAFSVPEEEWFDFKGYDYIVKICIRSQVDKYEYIYKYYFFNDIKGNKKLVRLLIEDQFEVFLNDGVNKN